jgi:hypothetical protein
VRLIGVELESFRQDAYPAVEISLGLHPAVGLGDRR